jgi:anti-sigma-K factor RskA
MSAVDENGPERASDDIVAAEYVLGVLPADERRQVARRIEAEPAFARLVERWEADLSPIAAGYPEVEAPAGVKAALDRRLFLDASASTRPASAAAPGQGFWSSLAFWRGLAAAALAALALFVALPLINPPTPTPDLRLVASLAPQESDVHYFVVYDARTRDIGLSHVTGARAEGRDFELWVIEGQQPPASLGVIPAGSNVHLAVSDAVRDKIESGAVFAISLEPAGGSPTGQPTGPVVAAGDLKTI